MKLRDLIPLMTLATLLFGASLSFAAGPVTGAWPTRWVHDFACINCHGAAGSSFNGLTTNVCLNCHGQGTTAGANIPLLKSKPGFHNPANTNFAIGDSSDALGSVSAINPALVGDQTSHSWSGSDNNPSAGATPPVAPLFAGQQGGKNYSGPYVTCARCHDPHGWMVDYAPYYSGNPKLLKLGAGSELAMCNDCHRSWAADQGSTESTGVAPVNVHPMVADYAAVAAAPANAGKYNNVTAVNAAPGEIALNGTGGIDCLTCHGVHFTDSDASTTDGVVANSVAHLNPGNTSRGKILKADGPGISNSNLCQTCHKYAEHGIDRGNPIGCLVCHGAHIPDLGGALNNYMLRSDFTVKDPNHAGNKVVSGLTFDLADAKTTKERLWDYCFNCHDSAAIPVVHDPNWNCADCHSHDVAGGSWSAAGGCNTCHGYPPSEAAAANGTNNGYAVQSDSTNYEFNSGHYKPENTTLHSLHATTYSFSCVSCHAGHGHIDKSYDDVFLATGNQIYNGAGRLTGADIPTYSNDGVAGPGTCSSVYCHSNGGPRGATPLASAPVTWTTFTPITTCDACHGNDVTSMGTLSRNNSATHTAHLNKGYGCQVCHFDTATSAVALSATAIGGTHVNGSADVAFDATMINPALGAGPYNTNGTCSVYCHSNSSIKVSPDWDDNTSGDCGTCHQYSVANVATGNGTALGGAHAAHLFAANGPKITTCATCHGHNGAPGSANAAHVNGAKDVTAGVCDDCHGSDGSSTSGNDQIPNWYTPATVTCETCHTGSFIADFAVIGGPTAPPKTSYYSFGHGKLATPKLCTDCHDAAAAGHFDGDQLDKRLKDDPAADGGAEVFTASNNLWCQDCHAATMPHFTTGGASTDGSACLTCHDPHGQSQDAMIADLIGGKPVSGFVAKGTAGSYFTSAVNGALEYEGVCQVCHDSAAVNYYTLTVAPTGHNAGAVCVSCHPHSTTPAFKASCNGCHGDVGTGQYWPFGSGGNIPTANDEVGEHAAHVLAIGQRLGYGDYNSTMYSDVQQKNICEYCHAATSNDTDHGLVGGLDADVFVAAGGARHAKSLWGAADADATYNAGPDTCSNVDCHNGKETLDGSYGWYDNGTAACLMCHADVSVVGTATGVTHTKHTGASTLFGATIACADCHDGATVWGTTPPAAGHIDGSWTVQIDVSGVPTAAYSAGNCGTNDCHNNGKGGAPAIPGYTWGTADANDCGMCHAAVPATDDHSVHLSTAVGSYGPKLNTNCGACHNAGADNTSMVGRTTHLNSTVTFKNVDTSTAEVNSGEIGFGANDAIDSCDLCHGGNVAANLAKDEWITLNRVSCESCHGDYTAAVIGGITAPSRAGTNYDSVGHGRTGTGKPNRACADCHDELSAHISGVANDANRLDVVNTFDYETPAQRNDFCNTCHTSVGAMPVHFASTGGSTSGLYCVSCHDPHGQSGFDAMVDATVGGTLVAEGTRTVTGFADRGVRGSYSNPGPAFDGICQTCHTATVFYFNQGADSDGSHNAGSNCISCHMHNADTAFAASCNACHGDANGQYWPNGDADTQILTANDDAGRHEIHMARLASAVYGLPTTAALLADPLSDSKQKVLCEYCHAAISNDSDHGLAGTADVFDAAGGARHAKALWDAAGAASSDDASYAAGSCATVDCHNNKATNAEAGKDFTWNGTDSSECLMCHDNVTGLGTHAAHLGATNTYGLTIGCNACHTAATAWGTAPATGHWDGAWTISGSGIASYSGSWATGAKGTCGTNDCHNDGKGAAPIVNSYTWETAEASACGICHAATPTTEDHGVHLSGTYGPNLGTSCNACHQANANNSSMNLKTTHINGTITFNDNVEVATGDIDDGTNTVNSCDLCHGGSADAATAKGYWYTASRVTCESCHVTAGTLSVVGGTSAPPKDQFGSLGHGDSGLSGAPGCSGCHDQDDAGHFDGNHNDDLRLKADPNGDTTQNPYATDGTLWCQECHTENAHYHTSKTVTAGNESLSGDRCAICHEPHGEGMGSNSDAMLIVGANFTNRGLVSSYIDATGPTYEGVCQVCHNSAEVNHYSNSVAGDGHNAATVCINCHTHGSAPAFQGGECYDCHGDGVAEYWPQSVGTNDRTSNAFSDFNDNGRHQEHMTVLAAKLGFVLPGSDVQQRAACAYCHDLTDGDHAGLNNGFADVFASGAKKYWDASNDADATWNTTNYNTCSNIDCHNSKETLAGSYGWYDTGTSACIMCHADVTDGSTPSSTGGTHVAHTSANANGYGVTITCATCHDGATVWGTTPPAVGHMDGNWTVQIAVSGMPTAAYAAGTCGTNDCHEDGKAATPVVNSYRWGTAEASACGICHAENMTTAAHAKHLANSSYVPACTSCHTAATAATHLNNLVNFDTGKVAYASGTCSTNICHSAGNWLTSVAPSCENCHSGTYIAGDNTGTGGSNYLPQYNMHDVIPRISGIDHKFSGSCALCHSALAALPTHMDGIWEVDSAANASSQGRGLSNATIALNFVDGTPGTCATTCHQDDGGWSRKWSASAANNDGSECANCHGDFANGWVAGISARHSADLQLAANHGGPSAPCMTCHTIGDGAGAYAWATQHRDGAIQLSDDLGWVDHGATVGCANCHSDNDGLSDGGHEMQDTYNGDGADGGLNRWGRTFQAGGGGSCTSCHNLNGMDHTGINESALIHNAHIGSNYILGCTDCHSNAGPGHADHFNGTVNFNATNIVGEEYTATHNLATDADEFTGSCATNSCHDADSNEWKNGLNFTVADACVDCHASSGILGVAAGGAYPPTSNEHNAHLGNDAIFLPASDCDLCHGPGAVTGSHTGHKNKAVAIDLAGSSIAYDGTTCTNSCHTTAASAWTSGTATLGCADCHGQAANTIGTPIHAGLSAGAGPAGDKHAVHVSADADYLGAATCTTCHGHSGALGNYATSGHVNGVPSFTAVITTTPAASGNDSCVNSCHLAADASEWISGSLVCNDCHGTAKSLGVAAGGGAFNGSDVPTTGRHVKHVASVLPILANRCTDCHGHSGVLGTSATSGHVNGLKTIGGGKLTAVNLPDCTNSCHDVNPIRGDWNDNAALGCVDCHSGSYVGPIATSGLHSTTIAQKHTVFSCTQCHEAVPSNKHLDGITDNAATAFYNFNATQLSYNRTTGCSALVCHSDAGGWRRKWVGVVDAKPLLTDSPGAAVCGNCHGTFTTGWRTGVSARHTGVDADGDIQTNHRGDAPNDCNLCHAWGNGNYIIGMHLNSKVELNSNVGFEDISAVDGLVGCANCHVSSDGTADEQHSFVDTDKVDFEGEKRWGRAFVNGPQGSCYSCHQANGATHLGSNESLALHNSHNASPYIDVDGNFIAGVGSTFNNCDTCHGHNGTGGHANGTVVFGNRITAPVNYALAGTYDGSCTNSCHITEAGEWNTTTGLSAGSTDSCTSCHGPASVTFFDGALGTALTWSASPAGPNSAKHAKHLGGSYAANCASCHGPDATTGAHATHKNKVLNNSLSYVRITQTCTNSCHIANTSGDWTGAGSLACDDCHGVANVTGTLYRDRTSGSHSSHVATGSAPTSYGSSTNNSSGTSYDFGCGQCHPTASGSHLNGSTDELQAGINYNNPAAGQCSSNSCHQDGQSPSGPPAFVPTWGVAFVGDSCNKCHGNSPVSGAHSAHKVGIHADDTDSSDDGTNIQGIYDGTSGNLTTGSGLASSHGNASTSTTINCLTCHFSTVNVWYNALGSACSNCHTDSNNVSTGNEAMLVADTAKHVNGVVDVVFQGINFRSKAQVREDITSIPELNSNWTRTNGYKAVDGSSYDLAKTSLNSDDYTDSTCTVACHNSIAATWVTPTGNCSNCHTSLPQ